MRSERAELYADVRRLERALFAASWERMVLLACAFELRADELRRADGARALWNMKQAFAALRNVATKGQAAENTDG